MSKIQMEKKCKNCGISFETHKLNVVYCSVLCRKDAWRKYEREWKKGYRQRNPEYVKKSREAIKVWASKPENKEKKREWSRNRQANLPVTRETRLCPECNHVFLVKYKKGPGGKTAKKFCSKKCRQDNVNKRPNSIASRKKSYKKGHGHPMTPFEEKGFTTDTVFHSVNVLGPTTAWGIFLWRRAIEKNAEPWETFNKTRLFCNLTYLARTGRIRRVKRGVYAPLMGMEAE